MTPTLMHDTWADTLVPSSTFTVPVYVGIYYSGAWHNISADVNELDAVTITRGRANETSSADPARLTLSLQNPTGTYSPRNPSSSLYGLIGRNTPIELWVYVGSAWHQRFYGEITVWPQTWGLKGSTQAFAKIEASGITRRLGQGASPLRSPLYRALSTLGSNLVGYWPCEDADGATQYSVAVGSQPVYIKGAPSTANYSGFPSSDSLPTLELGTLTAMAPSYTSSNQAQVRWVGYIPSTTTTGVVLLSVYFTGGTLARIDVSWTTGGSLKAEGFDTATGASVGTTTYAFGAQNVNLRMSLELQTSGSDVLWALATVQPAATGGLVGGGTFTGVTIGRVSRVVANPNTATLTSIAFGHLTIERSVTSLFDVSTYVLAGHAGEEAANRIDRLCAENDINLDLPVDTDSQLMGVQGTDDLLTLLRECETTDGGILYEPRDDVNALAYRTSESLYSQADEDLVTVAYVDNMLLPFEPVEDDQGLRNKVTVTRSGGSSSTVTESANTLGTQAVGIYDEQVTMSMYADADTLQQAGWLVHLGTFDEARWPQIGCDLADPRIIANTTLRNNLIGIDVGTRLEVTALPAWLPPDTVSQLVLGYSETITASSWAIVYNCTPARPYRVGFYGATLDRYSGEGTVLAADITTTATSLTVTPPNGISWTSADGSYVIVIDGETMTVTNVSGNTFTVTRSVNGVVKAHTSGAAVALADPCYYGL
jgi:hypothetical protein